MDINYNSTVPTGDVAPTSADDKGVNFEIHSFDSNSSSPAPAEEHIRTKVRKCAVNVARLENLLSLITHSVETNVEDFVLESYDKGVAEGALRAKEEGRYDGIDWSRVTVIAQIDEMLRDQQFSNGAKGAKLLKEWIEKNII